MTDENDEEHVSFPIDKNTDVATGVWTDVRVGQVTAEGCYTDEHGVLRDVGDNSVVAWHWAPIHCKRRGLKPEELVYHPETNAPWCPECWPYEKVWEEKEKRFMRRQKGQRSKQENEKREERRERNKRKHPRLKRRKGK